MGFCGPPTLAATSSDLHRDYLTRLCCALRFSQPLDASFRSKPSRPCFMPVTPLGFGLQRFPPAGSRHDLIDRDCPSCRFCDLAPSEPKSTVHSATRGSRDSCTQRIRTYRHHGLPGASGRSSPGRSPLRGISPRYLAPCFHETSSHGLAHSARWRTIRLRARSSESQRTEGRPSSEEAVRPSVGFVPTTRSHRNDLRG
jgi:hypothetical protein